MPFPAMCALVGYLVRMGHFWSGVALIVASVCHLRPGE